MASDRRAEFKAAQQMFRDREPVRALQACKDIVADHLDATEVLAFIQGILRHLNARIRMALQQGNNAEILAFSPWLIENPEFSTGIAEPFATAAGSLAPVDRIELLLPFLLADEMPSESRVILADAVADAISAERAVPPTPFPAFVVLRDLPGDPRALADLGRWHEEVLGHSDLPPVPPEAEALLAELVLEECPQEASQDDRRQKRKAVYDQVRALAEIADLPLRLVLERRIAHSEESFRPVLSGGTAMDGVWALLEASAETKLRDTAPDLSPVAAALFATPVANGGTGQRIRIILSLWLRAINYEASQDRIGYIWLVLDPLIHVIIICAVPLFLHPATVFDMPTFAFGVIGACFWMTFRSAAMGALAGGGVLKSQLEHPIVRRFDIIVARALNALIVYFFVGTALLGVAIGVGLASPPVFLTGFLGLFLMIWIMGLSYGIVINSLLYHYPGVRRINGFFIRLVAFTSGLFFVSEQLPDSLSSAMLWNPLLHVVQFARGCWFAEYQTSHGDPIYVVFCFAGLLILALTCLTLDERQPERVRA